MLHVWSEPWLKEKGNAFVQTIPSTENCHFRACDIIDQTTGCWNTSLISQVFDEIDYIAICKMPANLTNTEDTRIWSWSKDGNYTVRSAYHGFRDKIVEDRNLSLPGDWKTL